jgi:hypothetical protein
LPGWSGQSMRTTRFRIDAEAMDRPHKAGDDGWEESNLFKDRKGMPA